MPPRSEADTCRRFVLPKLYEAGWDDDRISEQRTFTEGRVVVNSGGGCLVLQSRARQVLLLAPGPTSAVRDHTARSEGSVGWVCNRPRVRHACAQQPEAAA